MGSERSIKIFVTVGTVVLTLGWSPTLSFAAGREEVIVDRPIADILSGEVEVWRTKTQSVFDPAEHSIVRRIYTVWDAMPSRDLDFMWTPRSPRGDQDGKINGIGKLIWRSKDMPAYDSASIFAEFKGTMKDGRAEGEGTYFDRAGVSYKGGWKSGLMDGFGRLMLSNGAEYVGPMSAGKANGTGRYIESTGEIFEGDFVDGKREGIGTTTLPNGNSYQSTWAADNETTDSHRLRLAQSGGQSVPGGDNDIRIGITVDKSKAQEGDADVTYVASSDSEQLTIVPDDGRLMKMWKGDDEIELLANEDEGYPLEYGVFSKNKGQLIPLTLSLKIENRSAASISVTGAYLAVASSVTDLQPAVQLRDLSYGFGCGSDFQFNPTYRAENFGWGTAQNAIAHFTFANPNVNIPPTALDMTKAVGNIERTAAINFEPELRVAGVNTAELKSRGATGFSCTTKSPAACLQQIKGTGLFGSIASHIDLQDPYIMVSAAGTLDYTWRDSKGGEHTRSSPYNVRLPLGHLKVAPECGEGGAPIIVNAKALQFKLDQSDYRLPISFQRSIPNGRTSQFIVSIKADKSSEHDFRVVLQLADGREISSRPVSLLYYLPSWFPPN